MDALVNGRVFTGEVTLDGHGVLLEAGRVLGVVEPQVVPAGARRIDLGGRLLAPGFVDLQVNGGGGVLFNDQPTVAGLRAIADAHRRSGTTALLPTLITSGRATMQAAARAVEAALRDRVPGILGIHFEGPHLDPARAGVHDPALIRPPGEGDLGLLTSLRHAPTLVTLAPNRVEHGFIEALTRRGVTVSAGHTDGTFERLSAAHGSGISGYTHLFNAMSPLTSREPGAVGAALADPDIACSIIVDGHHVHPASVRIAFEAKPRGQLFLVSDAMPPVGTTITSFALGGRTIEVRDGRCTTADGTLAGAAIGMVDAVRHAVRLARIPLEDALRMASTWPARFLGLGDGYGRIGPGARADLVLLDDALEVVATWLGGERREESA